MSTQQSAEIRPTAAAGLPPKFISPKRTREITSLSEREQKRRALQGRFPKPVPLSEENKGGNTRIAYVEAEVIAWQEARIQQRDRQAALADEPKPEQPSNTPAAVLGPPERSTAKHRSELAARPPPRSSRGRRLAS
jgi:predicted DNA-binding transcriptional regulator AlpA